MKPVLALRKPLPALALPLLATLIVAGSVFFSGVYAQGGAKDIDSRYFYAAARCWAAGTSPYEPATYEAMFRSIFGSAPDALFVAYLPTLLPVVLPMAAFDWAHAASLFSLMNFGAAMVLYWACWRLVRESIGGALRPVHWFWVVLGSTIGGVAGTVYTGQTSLFITAACALALVGCRLQRPWLTVIGLVVASAKPHLSGPMLLFIAVFEPGQRKAVAIALAVVAVIFGYAAAVDAHLLQSYVDSVRAYTSLTVNDPAKLTGFVALLLRLGLTQKAAEAGGVIALVGLLGFVAWYVRRAGKPLAQLPLAIMLLVLSTGLARSIQGYDLCCYALAIALLATTELRAQIALVVPALIIWRPGLLLRASDPALTYNLVATFAWFVLLVAVVWLASRAMRGHRRSAGSASPA